MPPLFRPFMLLSVAALLTHTVGCADGTGHADDAVEMGIARAAMLGFSLSVDDLNVGEESTLSLSGGTPFSTAYVLLATGGIGAGPCPPGGGGLCLDIVGGLSKVATITLDKAGSGEAVFSVNPSLSSVGSVSLQSIIIDGADSLTSIVVTAPVIAPPEPVICATGGDYTTIQQAVNDHATGGSYTLCSQTFYENIDITDGIHRLTAQDPDNPPTIDGSSLATVINVHQNSGLFLSNLTITNGSGAAGGGIFCDDSVLTAQNVTITQNETTGDGGGILANSCRMRLRNTMITDNEADLDGGGVYINGQRAVVVGTTISGNRGREGGGLYASEYSSGSTPLTLHNSLITDNLADTVDDDDGDGELDDLWGTGGGGGGLWLGLDNATVTQNEISNNQSNFNGGGIFLYSGYVTFQDNVVDNNLAYVDGGGFFANYGSHTVASNAFSNNVAYDDGGGLRLYHGSSSIFGNTFTGNSAGDDGGGAKLSHSTSHEFHNNTLDSNETGDSGGGLELDNDSSYIYDCVFIDNTARRGGGLHNWRNETNFSIERVIFDGNIASDCGGAVQIDNNPYRLSFINSHFEENEAERGGAICTDLVYRDPDDVGGIENYYETSNIHIHASTFVGNSASEGGAMYLKAAEANIYNILSSGDGDGAGSFAFIDEEGDLSLTNGIIVDSVGASVIEVESAGQATATYSDFYNNAGGFVGLTDPIGSNGNISDDPLLFGVYELGDTSPCIDTGDPTLQDPDGSPSDMGAYGGPYAAPPISL
jgi:hypothetical protein